MEVVVEKPEDVIKHYDEDAGLWKYVKRDKGPLKSLELVEISLQNLGLSKNEVRVYLHLARSGERKASELSEALCLHRTETYRILRDLEKQGLVSSVFEKPLKFIATPFEKAVRLLIEAKKMQLQLLEQKKIDLIDVWLSLPRQNVESQRKEIFQILEGEDQFSLKSNEILNCAKQEIFLFTAENDLSNLYYSGFLDNLAKISKKNIKVRLLTNKSQKSQFFIEKSKLRDMRFSGADVRNLPSFLIADNEQVILKIKSNGDEKQDEMANGRSRAKLASLWTNYEAFVGALTILFSELWSNSSIFQTVIS
jgi:sugar-specific transcriptional regulator TrmB